MTIRTLVSIEGEKIRLRDWTVDDIEAYRHWQQPGREWQTLDGPYFRSSEDISEKLTADLKAKIETWDFPTPRMRLVIADRSSNKMMGTVATYWESKETLWLSAGLTIFDPAYWGKGIGKEALKLWVDYVFNSRPDIVRLDMRTWSGNQGMMKLAEKLGFKQEACFRKARIVDGKYYDSLGYGILREEWSALYPQGFKS